MENKYDGCFYVQEQKHYYKVIKECCIDVDECENVIHFTNHKNNSTTITVYGSCSELSCIDSVKAKKYFEEFVI